MKTLTLLALAISLLAPHHFLFKATSKPCDDFVTGYTACITVKVNGQFLLHGNGVARPLSALRDIYIQVPGHTYQLEFLSHTLAPDGSQRWYAEVVGATPVQPVIITWCRAKGWFMEMAAAPTGNDRLARTPDRYEIVEFK